MLEQMFVVDWIVQIGSALGIEFRKLEINLLLIKE